MMHLFYHFPSLRFFLVITLLVIVYYYLSDYIFVVKLLVNQFKILLVIFIILSFRLHEALIFLLRLNLLLDLLFFHTLVNYNLNCTYLILHQSPTLLNHNPHSNYHHFLPFTYVEYIRIYIQQQNIHLNYRIFF